MAQQRLFHFRAGDVVAGRDDHVVAARAVIKVAVAIHLEGVARQVPAILHVFALARIGQVAAAGRSLHGQAARHAWRLRRAGVVDDARLVAGDGLADGAAAYALTRGGYENVQHFGGADTVRHGQSRRRLPGVARGQRQRLAGRHGQAQAAQVVLRGQRRHLAVKRGRREADRGPVGADGAQQGLGRELFQQDGARAEAQGKQQQAAQAEGKRQRRRADEDVVGAHLQYGAGKAVANGQQIAMHVHGALGDARRARGKADQANVVGRRIACAKGGCVGRHVPFQFGVGGAKAQHGRQAGQAVEFPAQALRAQHGVDLGLGENGRQLARAQQRHGGHGDAAGLQHGQQAGGHHGRIRAAQQHAVAGDQAQVGAQHVGDAVDVPRQLGVAPALAIGKDGDALAAAIGHGRIEQGGDAVETRRIIQLGQVKAQLWPERARRQVRARKVVMGRGGGTR